MIEISASALTDLTTSSIAIPITGETSVETGAKAVPDRCHLSQITLLFSSVVTATSATWFMSHDAAGNHRFTASKTDTIEGLSIQRWLDDLVHRRTSDGVLGTVYVHVELDVGTAKVVARLTHEEG